jgi:endonuclease/exonuclease/phosphatase family metal-dependent hydrolase
MKRKILSFLMATVILLSVFLTACNKDQHECGGTPVTSEAEKSEDTGALNTDIMLFDSNVCYYSIVRGTYATDVEVNAAVELNKAFRKVYPGDWKVTIGDDFFKGQNKNEFYEVEGKEILVGMTNRKETKEVHDTLAKDEFKIKVIGEKLVIVGFDEYATSAAVEHFIETYLKEQIEDKLELPLDLELSGESSLRKVSLHDEAAYRIMTWNLGCMVSSENKGEVECIDILLRHLPDVMGLQECNADVHNKVLKNLPSFYAFANKTHKSSSTVNYTPIIYNKDLFTLVKSEIVWLRGRYTGTNTKSLNWAVFEDKSGERFALINYHGAVCSNSYKGFENFTSAELSQQALVWKLDNVVQVIEIKNSIVAEFGNIPIMVSGDNNFNSSSQPYANLTSDGFTDAEITARISRVTGYKTSYTYGNVPGDGLSIDHIFGLNGIDFVVHSIVRGNDVWKASDHTPVYVDFNVAK